MVGRSNFSSIIIPHASVSRVHATIIRDGDTLSLQDLGSRNGTFVNGARVGSEPVAVGIGDAIQIGQVECSLVPLDATGQISTERPPLPTTDDS